MTLPDGFALNMDEHNRRRIAEGMPTQREVDIRSDYRCAIEYPCRRLRLYAEFPEWYKPDGFEATATFGNIPISFIEHTALSELTCESHRLESTGNRALLSLVKPSPGYTFGLRWQPIPKSRGGKK